VFEGFIQNWWPQITALFVLIAYISRQTAATNERLHQLEKKMEAIWQRYNTLIDYLMQQKDNKK